MVTLYDLSNGGLCRSVHEYPDNALSESFLRENNSAGLVLGCSWPNVSVPVARFKKLRDVGPQMFTLERQGDTFAIRNVPLYKGHPDTRKIGHVSDRKFLDRMVKNFWQVKQSTEKMFGNSQHAWLPKFHIGHTTSDPSLPEQPCIGQIDNLFRVEDFLFGDLVNLSQNAVDDLIGGKYPDRSAEVDIRRARLLSVAALGYRAPHFALPQMKPELMRRSYTELLSQHSYVEDVQRFLLLDEDTKVLERSNSVASTKTKKKAASPEEIARFAIEMQTNDTARDLFEKCHTELVQKHMDESGESAPPQGDMMSKLIAMAMQMAMSKMMNPGGMMGGTGLFTFDSDALDLESKTHHAGGCNEFEEEGTSVIDDDDLGIRKGKGSGDTDVRSADGAPTETISSDGPPDSGVIDSEGKMTELSTASDLNKILRAAFDPDLKPADRVNAQLDLTKHIANQDRQIVALSNTVSKFSTAIRNLEQNRQEQSAARRKEFYENRLRDLFRAGCPAVTSHESFNKHLKHCLSLSDELAKNHIEMLEEMPKMHSHNGGVQVTRDQVTRHSLELVEGGSPDDMLKNEFAESGLAKEDYDAFAIADKWLK